MKWNEWVLNIYIVAMTAFVTVLVMGGVSEGHVSTLSDLASKYAGVLMVPLTLVYVIFTWNIVKEARIAREQERSPRVIVTIEPSDAIRGGLFYIIIENVGSGPAFNVATTLSPEMMVRPEDFNHGGGALSSRSILHPPVLKPGQIIKTYVGRWNEFSSNACTATIKCVGENGKYYEFFNEIDMSVYLNLVTLGDDPAESVAGSLKSIKDALEGIVRGNNRLAVNTYTRRDREEEAQRNEEWLEQVRAENRRPAGPVSVP